MRRTLVLLACLLSGFLPLVRASDVALQPVSKEALYFRMEVGTRPGHFIDGWIEESRGTGKGYDCAVLDLDRDGVFETKQTFPVRPFAMGGPKVPRPLIHVEREGVNWCLDIYTVGNRRPRPKDGKHETTMSWSMSREKTCARFINGTMTLATEAGKAPAVRIGPPLEFRSGVTVRGPRVELNVGLHDSTGATLRSATRKGRDLKISVTLKRGKKTALKTDAEYG